MTLIQHHTQQRYPLILLSISGDKNNCFPAVSSLALISVHCCPKLNSTMKCPGAPVPLKNLHTRFVPVAASLKRVNTKMYLCHSQFTQTIIPYPTDREALWKKTKKAVPKN